MGIYKVLTPFLDSISLEFHEEGDVINVDNERKSLIIHAGIELEEIKETEEADETKAKTKLKKMLSILKKRK